MIHEDTLLVLKPSISRTVTLDPHQSLEYIALQRHICGQSFLDDLLVQRIEGNGSFPSSSNVRW